MDAINAGAIKPFTMEAGNGVDSRRGTVTNATPYSLLVSPQSGLPVNCTLALAVASAIASRRLRLPLKAVTEQHCGCAFIEPKQIVFVDRAIGLHEVMLEVLSLDWSSSLLRRVCSNIRYIVREFLELSQPVFLWPMGIKAQML